MPDNTAARPSRSHVTRQDRAIRDDAWIAGFLGHAGMGTLASAVDEQPFLSTLLFVYDADRHAIYIHTSRRGRVWENLQANPRVCFSAAEMGRLLPANTALNFSVEYQSVVAFGTARLVADEAEAVAALRATLEKYFTRLDYGQDYREIVPEELAVTAVFRIDVEEWSGKRKAAPEDFPGAFRWES